MQMQRHLQSILHSWQNYRKWGGRQVMCCLQRKGLERWKDEINDGQWNNVILFHFWYSSIFSKGCLYSNRLQGSNFHFVASFILNWHYKVTYHKKEKHYYIQGYDWETIKLLYLQNSHTPVKGWYETVPYFSITFYFAPTIVHAYAGLSNIMEGLHSSRTVWNDEKHVDCVDLNDVFYLLWHSMNYPSNP